MIEYTLIRSRRRTISVQLNFMGKVTVKAPIRCGSDAIERFLWEKQSWILVKQQQIAVRNAPFETVISMGSTLCFGKEYQLIYSEEIRESGISGDILYLSKTHGGILSALQKWTAYNTSQYVAERLREFAPVTNCGIIDWKLTNAQGKWGSCDAKHRLTFNWRLAMLPVRLIDYVIVHELCHLTELNHSKRFWELVAQILPDYKSTVSQIKKYSFLTSLYRK